MKTYKFHVGYPSKPICDCNNRDIEEFLTQMQEKGWEFMGISSMYIRSGSTAKSSGFIFRKEEIECLPNGINDKV